MASFKTTHGSAGFHNARRGGQISVFDNLGRGLRDFVEAVFKVARRRRDLAQLQRLDDRMLGDLGLTRADIDRAVLTPWHQDPTAGLTAARRGHRRLSRR